MFILKYRGKGDTLRQGISNGPGVFIFLNCPIVCPSSCYEKKNQITF